ncbi:MAG TPA: efflux transporter outer membrane subunit [Phenylobacterium sp.]|nr:efflux transporter outer membrane subunit [Phenylobacterium sp.]
MPRAKLFALAGTALALTGCSLAPPYSPPVVTMPQAYKETGPWTPASPADAAPRGRWWTVYGDETLNGLEEKIEAGNPNLALALARYDEARANLAMARASLVPELDVGGSALANKQSSNRPLRAGGQSYYQNDTIGATLSYEFDLWGRVRNMVAAGKADAQASAADVASTRLSLEAQLADAYLNLRGLDAQSALLDQTTGAYARALNLTQVLHSGGAVAGLDVGRAQTQLGTTQAQQTEIKAQRALYEHAIAALVGEPASVFSIAPDAKLPPAPRTPVSAPSVLLQRRPDIAAAERRTAAANAQIGVARAALYPSLTLSATGGFQNAGGANLLSAANSWWAIGPSLAMALFDGGRRKAVVRASRDQFDEAAATYRATVLTAFQQVEDNLALSNRLADEAGQQMTAVTAAQKTEALSLVQYKMGAVTYLEVVIAQTADLQAQQTELSIETRRLLASVDLVRALGGGWDPAAPLAPPS